MAKISYGCQTYPWKMNMEKFAGDVPHMAQVAAEAGFAGLEAEEDGVHFSPHLPEKWRKLKFRFNYGGSRYRVEITKDILKIIGEDAAKELRVTYMGNIYTCSAGSTLKIQMENREGK